VVAKCTHITWHITWHRLALTPVRAMVIRKS